MTEWTIDMETGDLGCTGLSIPEGDAIAPDLLSGATEPAAADYRERWGRGPWLTEGDRAEWQDAATGLTCLLRRAHHGAWCGYVGVPREHAWWGRGRGNLPVLPMIHGGGLNYGGECDGNPETGICHVPGPGEPDDLWWFGFSCDATADFVPLYCRVGDILPNGRLLTYRTIAYARAECETLAAQLYVEGRAQRIASVMPSNPTDGELDAFLEALGG